MTERPCKYCPHPMSEHNNSLKCRTCKSDCGINCVTPAYLMRLRERAKHE